jgi:Macrocin-O-methyltransferase (TylF)
VPQLARDGIVLIDDYQTWAGCARAVHEFLAIQPVNSEREPLRLRQFHDKSFRHSSRKRLTPCGAVEQGDGPRSILRWVPGRVTWHYIEPGKPVQNAFIE